tara:strand:- start:1752 stop:2354 length:603 start_codon:yes stop_codon:yes gene_type:complete
LDFSFFVDPGQDSESVLPFWSPSFNPHILKCTQTPQDQRDQSAGALLSQLPLEWTTVRTSNNEHHVLLSGNKRSLQLVFDREIDPEKPFYFEVNAVAPGILREQSQAIACLDSILKRGEFIQSFGAMPARFRVTPDLLYAVDLLNLGFSQREIAIRVFGEDAVKDGWDNVTHYIQSRTYRMIKKGRNLIERSHRAFFRRS